MIPTLEELRQAPAAKLHVPPPTLEEFRQAPPSRLAVPIPPTRHVIEDDALPFTPPPYTSVMDDVFMQNAFFKHTNEIRQDALFPVRLRAGEQMPPGGDAGIHSTPREDNLSMLGAELGNHPPHLTVPEAHSGQLLAVSI